MFRQWQPHSFLCDSIGANGIKWTGEETRVIVQSKKRASHFIKSVSIQIHSIPRRVFRSIPVPVTTYQKKKN